jgi:hypothetical protein
LRGTTRIKKRTINYKSILCQQEPYLLELVGYIHLNPLRVQARSLVCYWAVQELGMTTVAVSTVSGLCPTAVTKAVARGELFAKSKEISLQE